ncbi:hypothetical protein ACMGDK_11415 [Chryseobacterium sp. DT-3]|uniref:hypothetical protein n=1 Tax=Chryseobacterium sp. DT-3 TaxID=3396164 RepID=UPI003F1BA299
MEKQLLNQQRDNIKIPLKLLKEKVKILKVVSKFSTDIKTLGDNYKFIKNLIDNNQ